jgi:hypothetical protein
MDVVEAIGAGVAAGLVGTVALTVTERVEMRLTGRDASTVPGEVGVRLLRRDPAADPELVERLNPVVHWAHGAALGAARGLLDLTQLGRGAATLAFFPLTWGGDATLYRVLGVAPAPWRWSRSELATDLLGKGVLAFATSLAYVALRKALASGGAG